MTSDATFLPGIGTFARPTPVQANDGRFTVKPHDSRYRDLIVAGPGFERRVIRAVPLKQDDIGDVEVTRGHTLEGTVRDESGKPVPHATVSFSPSMGAASREHVDELTDLLLGNITVTADDRGHYVIKGVSQDIPSKYPTYGPDPMQLSARFGHEASVPVVVPDADARLDLTVHPAGTLELLAPGREHGEIVIIDVLAPGTSEVRMRFSLYDQHARKDVQLPSGTYDLTVSARCCPDSKEHVAITAGATTRFVAE